MKVAILMVYSLIVAVQVPHISDNDRRKLIVDMANSIENRSNFEDIKNRALDELGRLKPNATEQERDSVINLGKFTFYNMMYHRYECATITPLASDLEETKQRIAKCIREKSVEAVKFNKLFREYADTIGSENIERCGLVSRLSEAEKEFPPFDYLTASSSQLFDFSKMNECLLSGVK